MNGKFESEMHSEIRQAFPIDKVYTVGTGNVLMKIEREKKFSQCFFASGSKIKGQCKLETISIYSVKQSDRNSSNMDLFHKPITYEQHA